MMRIVRRITGKRPAVEQKMQAPVLEEEAFESRDSSEALKTPPKCPAKPSTASPLGRMSRSRSPRRTSTSHAQSPKPRSPSCAKSPSPSKACRPRLSRGAGRLSLGQEVSEPVAPTAAQQAARRRSSIAASARTSLAGTRAVRRSLMHRASFPHRDFANPEAETCWLSCLFQSLWHSVVFHTAFEQHLSLQSESPDASGLTEEEPILAALQATWADYQSDCCSPRKRSSRAPAQSQDPAALPGSGETGAAPVVAEQRQHGESEQQSVETETDDLVPAEGLAEAFGKGYGDMSEALAIIQDELSQSSSPAAVAIADQMILLPLSGLADLGGAWPGPADAWKLAKEWQATTSPLIAVDLTLPTPTREDSKQLAQLWVPASSERSGGCLGDSEDGRSNHRVVALVCFMWNLRHYVAFCCRQSDPSRCLFFNDLPCLTAGAPRDLPWSEVPSVCEEHFLTPRLILYESVAASQASQFAGAPPAGQ
eukprot:TRINITY_DN72645_c0_g1_i1.p1 TRINITY_DN72645_c0_g1~~TRINITY_DN72645_c0_g1_i1.p1  ORF type:complete len:481 (-),score=90.72 TRINITY_DN72645_c0_g1_i1:7-1449(-)